MEEKLYTVKQIAEIYEVSVPGVYYWLERGLPYKIKKVVGRRPFKVISMDDVDEFLNLGVR